MKVTEKVKINPRTLLILEEVAKDLLSADQMQLMMFLNVRGGEFDPCGDNVEKLFTKEKYQVRSLDHARELVAKKYKYDSWEEIAKLADEAPKPGSIKRLSENDGEKVSIEKKIHHDCEFEHVIFTYYLHRRWDRGGEKIKVGEISAIKWDYESKGDFKAGLELDALGANECEFGMWFDSNRHPDLYDEEYLPEIFSFYFINDLAIEYDFNELYFGKLMIKNFFMKHRKDVEAFYAWVAPVTLLGDDLRYDYSKYRNFIYNKIFKDLSFSTISDQGSEYYELFSMDKNPGMYAFPKVVEENGSDDWVKEEFN